MGAPSQSLRDSSPKGRAKTLPLTLGEVAERSEDGEGRGGIYLIPPTTLLRWLFLTEKRAHQICREGNEAVRVRIATASLSDASQ